MGQIPKKKAGTSTRQHQFEGNGCNVSEGEFEDGELGDVTVGLGKLNMLLVHIPRGTTSTSMATATNVKVFRWCKISLLFLILVIFFHLFWLFSVHVSFLGLFNNLLRLCVSFIPRNWNGGLDTFFCAYIHSYIHTGLEGSEMIFFFIIIVKLWYSAERFVLSLCNFGYIGFLVLARYLFFL